MVFWIRLKVVVDFIGRILRFSFECLFFLVMVENFIFFVVGIGRVKRRKVLYSVGMCFFFIFLCKIGKSRFRMDFMFLLFRVSELGRYGIFVLFGS